MEQLPEDDPRVVARRVYQALCKLYPDRYIALIEPRGVGSDRAPSSAFGMNEGVAAAR
jgi:hypothetical protein